MDGILEWLERFWSHTGGRVLYWKEFRKDKRERYKYWEYQRTYISTPPKEPPLSPTIIKSRHLQKVISPIPPDSRLLSLPAEIRLLIWECAIGGNLIAIYRENKRVCHGLIDETNSRITERDIPLNCSTIQNAVGQLPGPLRKNLKNPPRPNKLKVIALLTSCHLIYSEAIDFLYSRNTFVLLQNQSLLDLRMTISLEQFASIRSVHLHWQFGERTGKIADGPWNAEEFGLTLGLLKEIKHLDNFGVFVQGPLFLESTYRSILLGMKFVSNRGQATLPNPFVLRLPYPFPNSLPQNFRNQTVDEMMDDPSLAFQVVRPPREVVGELPDLEVGVDFGWRHGRLFLPANNPSDGTTTFLMRSYTLFTPMPPGMSWPCSISAPTRS